MPSLVGTTVAANYLKAAPSTQFGTRQLTVITITKAGLTSGADEELVADSLYSKIIRALQQTAEVWAVFTPVTGSDDYFNAIIATDTQWDGDTANQGAVGGAAGNGGFGILETALNLGAGTTGIAVTIPTGFVAPFHG